MKAHNAVARGLRDNDVDTMFGVLGDANMLYVTDFIRDEGGRYIGAVDERGAVLMANGYARVGNRLGVASLTHGPAVTNALTAVAEAARSRTPVLVLTGDTPAVRHHVQRIELPLLIAATGAHYQRARNSADLIDAIALAIRHALATRTPVVLDIPADLMSGDLKPRRSPHGALSPQAVKPEEEALDRALGLIASARRPILLAGRGAVVSGAKTELLALADAIGAPLGTTMLARDYFRGDPFDLGVLGTVAHEIAVEALAESDCVIAFGATLNPFTASGGDGFAGKVIVQIDTDRDAFGTFTPVDAAVIGDARAAAHEMSHMLRSANHQSVSYRSERLAASLAKRDPGKDFTDSSSRTTIDVRAAMIRLDEVLPRDRALVTDLGRFVAAAWSYVHVADPLAFAHTASFGSIGLGVAVAVGAATVSTDRVTVAIAGDGGAMMGLMEFSTAVRHGLPLVLVVVNDGCYGAEWTKLQGYGVDPQYALVSWPDLAGLGAALGGHAMTAYTLADLDKAADYVDRGDLPLLIDLRIDPAVDIGVLG